MRWPWERKRKLLVVEIDAGDDEDPNESTDALRRAREALRQAEANGNRMREVTGSIHRERQANHFSDALLRSMRRKES